MMLVRSLGMFLLLLLFSTAHCGPQSWTTEWTPFSPDSTTPGPWWSKWTTTDPNAPPPTFKGSLLGVITETDRVGSVVMNLQAVTGDTNSQIYYELIVNPHYYFALDQTTGSLTIAKELDRLALAPPNNVLTLTVEAQAGIDITTAEVTIIVEKIKNDHDPKIEFRNFHHEDEEEAMVEETALVGQLVSIISVIDLDLEDRGHPVVSIIAGNEAGHFTLDSVEDSHTLRVAGQLDRETISQYQLTVQAEDGGSPSRTSTATLTVNVGDQTVDPCCTNQEMMKKLSNIMDRMTIVEHLMVERDKEIIELKTEIGRLSLTPGPKGVKGDRGPTGSKGDQGPRGSNGTPGPKGVKGDRGFSGEKGSMGTQGTTGSSGLKGSKGDRGYTGSKGSTGSSGQKGSKGDRGYGLGIELRGGTYKSGNVFITKSDGYHGPVCDDTIETDNAFGQNFAKVVCRQLGFSGGTATRVSKFGNVPAKFAMDQVECEGSERHLLDCPHVTTDNCVASEGAGVICT